MVAGMADPRRDETALETPARYRTPLAVQQPDLLAWLGLHVSGEALEVAIEMTVRYLDIAERWGDRLPRMSLAELAEELGSQVPSIDPRDRWITELPLPVSSGERLAIGRLLRVVVAVSQRRLGEP